MKKLRVRLAVDQLEARTTPAGTFLRPPIESGAFVPPGIMRFFADTSAAPPPVQVGRDGSVAFLPPGFIAAANE